MLNLRPFEWFLIELIFYFLLWFINDYVASLVSGAAVVVITAILIVALIAEKIEPTRISRRYFWFMFYSILAPLIAGGLYIYFLGGQLDWLEQ